MYFKLHNKLYSCALSKGCALLELAVFFRKKGEAESKIQKSKFKLQEVKKSVDKLIVLIISKILSTLLLRKLLLNNSAVKFRKNSSYGWISWSCHRKWKILHVKHQKSQVKSAGFAIENSFESSLLQSATKFRKIPLNC